MDTTTTPTLADTFDVAARIARSAPAYSITVDSFLSAVIQGRADEGFEDWAVENGFTRDAESDHDDFVIYRKTVDGVNIRANVEVTR